MTRLVTRVRREFEFRRNGTAVIFARLDVCELSVARWVTDFPRVDDFVEFLDDLVRQTLQGLALHCIVDNLSARLATRSTPSWAPTNMHLHFTPTRQ